MEALETRIEQFNNWAAERVTVLETCYEGLKVPLNYRLNRKEPLQFLACEMVFHAIFDFMCAAPSL